MKNKVVVILFFGFVLMTTLYVSECRKFENARKEVVVDTIINTIVKVDTLEVARPIYITETIVDTMVIEKVRDSLVYLPRTQRYYRGDGYDAWVSGYKPNLDKIIVYPKTIYQYKTITEKETVYLERYRWNVEFGLFLNQNHLMPTTSLELETPTRYGFKVGLGYMGNEIYYGFGFKIRLN